MTILKQEALRMVNQLSDEKVKYVIRFIQDLENDENTKVDIAIKRQAFAELERIKLIVPKDFDYEKELEEAREEKYGSFN